MEWYRVATQTVSEISCVHAPEEHLQSSSNCMPCLMDDLTYEEGKHEWYQVQHGHGYAWYLTVTEGS